MILDYPDHTLLFPKKGGNSDAVSVQTDTVQVSSFFFFRLYITQLSLAVLYRNRFSYFASRERISFKNS